MFTVLDFFESHLYKLSHVSSSTTAEMHVSSYYYIKGSSLRCRRWIVRTASRATLSSKELPNFQNPRVIYLYQLLKSVQSTNSAGHEIPLCNGFVGVAESQQKYFRRPSYAPSRIPLEFLNRVKMCEQGQNARDTKSRAKLGSAIEQKRQSPFLFIPGFHFLEPHAFTAESLLCFIDHFETWHTQLIFLTSYTVRATSLECECRHDDESVAHLLFECTRFST